MTATAVRYQRPATGEFLPYYSTYIDKVPEGDVLTLLADQLPAVEARLRAIPESRGDHAYAPGKWSIKEMVGHLADTERVFSYRALRVARADTTPLPGFDENAWVPPAEFNARTLASLIDEWVAVRRASLALLRGLPPAAAERRGTASNGPISVRAIAYILHGHVVHHLGVLAERYGV